MRYISQFRFFGYIIVLILGLGLTACDPQFIEKTSETLSEGIYGAADALYVGNIPLATSYLNSVEKMVPVPNHRLIIKPIIIDGIGIVLLGDNLTGKKVYVVGSQEFDTLAKSNANLKTLLTQNQKNEKTYDDAADKQAADNKKVLNDLLIKYNKDEASLKAWHDSIFYKAYIAVQSLWFIIPAGIIGAILLCVFCPALIPVILSAAGTFCGLIIKVASGIISGIVSLCSAAKPTTTTTTTTPTTTPVTTISTTSTTTPITK